MCCAKLLRTVTSYKDFATTKRIYCAPVSAIFSVCACVFFQHGHLFSICKATGRAHHKCKVFYPLESVTYFAASAVFGGCARPFRSCMDELQSATSNFFNLLFIALDQCFFPESDIMIFGKLNLLQCLCVSFSVFVLLLMLTLN